MAMDIVVQGIITVTLISHRMMTNIKTNQIHLKTGTACRYLDKLDRYWIDIG